MTISNALWPPSAIQEWNSLNSEDDPELFGEGCLGFAARQELAGNLEIALPLLFELSNSTSIPLGLRRRARERLEVLQGGGPTSARAELLLRRLAENSTDPVALLAMGTAGMVFRAARLGILARLANAEAGLLTRGLLGRTVATNVAFGMEAPAFAIASRFGNAILGRSQNWDAGTLRSELVSSYLTLGGLRLGLWGGHSLHRSLGGMAPQGLAFQLSLQGGMLSGLFLAQGLERYFGLREQARHSSPWIDSLATLLQFHVAGRLVNSLFGRLRPWENSFEARLGSLPTLDAWGTMTAAMSTSVPEPISGAGRLQEIMTRPVFAKSLRGDTRILPPPAVPQNYSGDPNGRTTGEGANPEDYPRLLAEWGEAFQEQNRVEIERFLPEMRRWNECIEAGTR